MVLELMPRADSLAVPMLIAVVAATIVARLAGAHSIYSVRLAQRWYAEGRPERRRKPIPPDRGTAAALQGIRCGA